MIVKETKGNIIHIHSDEGKRIHQKGGRFLVRDAYEDVGRQHEWEESEERR